MSSGWLPGDVRPDVTGNFPGSKTGSLQTIEGSQGYQVVATAIGTGRIVWSDVMDFALEPSTLGPS